ncbi:glycosyltransferase family 4 protein [Myxosarcina sp. GI1]|uniref:glycosyltransferase family 4 protein n=1 Tax=Myxosarcina sp. GI1 TaxID=1541065 RepID=UPI000692041E|nr:glycosyltransferase family 4 protein [Myxosarcina sp. GI1]
MKILLTIHEKFEPNSGAAGSIVKLGKEYQKLGHEVHYFSMNDLPKKMHRLVKRVLFPEFVANRIASITGLDVVDASTGDIWFWVKVGQKFSSNRPLLVTRSHGLEHLLHEQLLQDARMGKSRLSWKYPLYRGSIYLSEIATSLKRADLVYLLNQQEREYVVNNLGLKTQNIRVVANGIPETFLNLPLEPLSKNQNDTIQIAQIGTYIPRKGIEYGSPAINSILLKYPHVKMTFLGTECRECPGVEPVYADFDPAVRDRITVIPRYSHEALPSLLRGHQIKLFPTLSEGFSLSLIEAMACGLAPITTAHPAALETVRDGYDAIVVPLRDRASLERAIERAIGDRNFLESLRQNAHATAQQYSWNHIARQSLSVYQQQLQAKQNQEVNR